jgi:hypothetical protein
MLKIKTVPRIFGILTDLASSGVPYTYTEARCFVL